MLSIGQKDSRPVSSFAIIDRISDISNHECFGFFLQSSGPPRLPLFGSYLFMMLSDFKFLHKGVLKFCKWYKSDIVGFHMGPFPIVAVHNAEGVREVLTRSEFDGRPGIYVAQMRGPNDELLGMASNIHLFQTYGNMHFSIYYYT